MKEQPSAETLEPERYELNGGGAYHFELARRDFFKAMGCGVAVVLTLNDALRAQESGGTGRLGGGDATTQELAAWLHVGEDGVVTVFTGKVEVGQDIRTSLTQAVAEELPCPLDSIRLVMGDTDLTPFDMGTFGSRTTPVMVPQLRKAAAAAREALIELAAAELKVDNALLTIADGKVINQRTKQSIDIGRLTRGQKLMKTIPGDIKLIPAEAWHIAGKPLAKINGRDFVTGKHRYASDVNRPGMLYGKVLRPPSMGATLVSADTRAAADQNPAVIVVRDAELVGVVASSEHWALQALSKIRAEWNTQPQPSQRDLFDLLRKQSNEGRGSGSRFSSGAVDEAMASADVRLKSTYTVAYIAHAPLEPRAAVAEWNEGKLTVWTGTQRPFGVRSELAQAFHIPESRVRVIVPDTGSGYGGKHTGECAVEAARLARAALKPVKLVWSREEEFAWAYLRPAGVIDVISGARSDGTITAWEFHNYNSGTSAIRTLYAIPNQRIEFHPANSPLRQGSYRGLAATANHFARESHMDELAHALKTDPVEFRLKNLKDARLRAVLEAAATRFGWGKAKPSAGRGFGIAGGFEKGGYVATCAEVEVDRASAAVKILRAVTAFECGAIVSPDHLKNQVEGAVVMGIGGAMFEAVEFENGKILNSRFSRYRVPRFTDVPVIETVLLDRKDLRSAGAGETPIVGIAPAVANAVFNATGSRLRSLPLVQKGPTEGSGQPGFTRG